MNSFNHSCPDSPLFLCSARLYTITATARIFGSGGLGADQIKSELRRGTKMSFNKRYRGISLIMENNSAIVDYCYLANHNEFLMLHIKGSNLKLTATFEYVGRSIRRDADANKFLSSRFITWPVAT